MVPFRLVHPFIQCLPFLFIQGIILIFYNILSYCFRLCFQNFTTCLKVYRIWLPIGHRALAAMANSITIIKKPPAFKARLYFLIALCLKLR